MGSAGASTAFSVTRDGKYHDANYMVDGDTVSVIYWSPGGVVRLNAPAERETPPEQTARKLLSALI
jgi:hypothetical protein